MKTIIQGILENLNNLSISIITVIIQKWLEKKINTKKSQTNTLIYIVTINNRT